MPYQKTVGGVIFLLFTLYWVIALARALRKNSRFHELPSDELRSLAEKWPELHCGKVLQVLKAREEDIGFAFPLLLKMASGENRGSRHMGWAMLRLHFVDALPSLDLSKDKPSREDRDWIRSLLDDMA